MSSNSENTDTVLEDLRHLSEGLLYQSETDAPLEVVRFSNTAPTVEEVTAWAEKPEESKVEMIKLETFFRPMISAASETTQERESVSRFQALQTYLEQHLKEVRVYRIGRRRITALVIGRASNGEWAGVKTELVET
ncbi:nuclease A inhibitor family protein [Pontibacter litorisediminis]|uniref:nuclease A inhibitor family protein n=1 Tax=Pontibacter litorisediminis TaxID=1846260 RepID=UPI0023EE295D|nr:nuclease A inhibitor family protein [Pontibacter litorisediminis]